MIKTCVCCGWTFRWKNRKPTETEDPYCDFCRHHGCNEDDKAPEVEANEKEL